MRHAAVKEVLSGIKREHGHQGCQSGIGDGRLAYETNNQAAKMIGGFHGNHVTCCYTTFRLSWGLIFKKGSTRPTGSRSRPPSWFALPIYETALRRHRTAPGPGKSVGNWLAHRWG